MDANAYYLELMCILLNLFLAIEIDEQNHEGRELIFEKTRGFRNKTWLQIY